MEYTPSQELQSEISDLHSCVRLLEWAPVYILNKRKSPAVYQPDSY